MTLSVNHYVKGMTIVQLEDGSTRPVRTLQPNERTDKTIKTFVSNSMAKIFNWEGLIQTTENGENIVKLDKGIEIQTPKGSKKISTSSWGASFALSEKQGFRESFLKKLAEMTPEGLFSGQSQASLILRHVSEPRKVSEGKWEVDIIATLVTFNRSKNEGNGIAFNKTITVEAIEPLPPATTEIAQKIYAARKSGLEIIEIVDYDLGKNKS